DSRGSALGRHAAILLVESGPLAGRKLVLAPGASVLIGRDEEAGLCLARDGAVSRQHCRIEWDGERGVVRDLGGGSGTRREGRLVNGSASVEPGSFLQVGESLVCMFVEDHTTFRGEPANAKFAADARAALSAEQGLYAVLDAARDARVLEILRES